MKNYFIWLFVLMTNHVNKLSLKRMKKLLFYVASKNMTPWSLFKAWRRFVRSLLPLDRDVYVKSLMHFIKIPRYVSRFNIGKGLLWPGSWSQSWIKLHKNCETRFSDHFWFIKQIFLSICNKRFDQLIKWKVKNSSTLFSTRSLVLILIVKSVAPFLIFKKSCGWKLEMQFFSKK